MRSRGTDHRDGTLKPRKHMGGEFEHFNVTLLDENYDGKADYKIPFKLADDLSGILSVGGKYHGVRRESAGIGAHFAVFQGLKADQVIPPDSFSLDIHGPE
jgi:hypothetical protein